MIARQLLAAAFAFPVVRGQDPATSSIDPASFLKETVNRISRFTVFDDVAAPAP